MIRSAKKQLETSTSIDYLKEYIDAKVSEVEAYFSSLKNRYDYLLSKFDALKDNIGTINDKLTEDTVDRLNGLGTYEDFVQGFFDAFSDKKGE